MGDLEEKIVSARAALYKKPFQKYNSLETAAETPQEARRKALLARQKRDRGESFDKSRGFLEEVFGDFNDDADNEKEMEVEKCPVKNTKKRNYRKNNIMMSEWMLEVPEDLIDKWTMVPCPVGRRTLLVANRGITKAYNRHGQRVGIFNSALPGGNNKDFNHKTTLLDCIWEPIEEVYYALDVLAWSNQAMFNCETDFRFFWLNSKLNESSIYRERDKSNVYPIIDLPRRSCECNLSKFLESLRNFPVLDGLLFYHREAHYTRGKTPLVTWLKPYMLSEVLGISVPEIYQEKPEGYIDVENFFATKTKRKNDDSMEFEVDATSIFDLV